MVLECPMWRGETKLLLGDVIQSVPLETDWRMTWFDGVMRPGIGLPKEAPRVELCFTQDELLRFSADLEDVNEVVLDAVCGTVAFRLTCGDSTTWRLEGSREAVTLAREWSPGWQCAELRMQCEEGPRVKQDNSPLCYITLLVYADFDPAEVSRFLGIEASRTRRAGQSTTSSRGRQIVSPLNVWMLSSEGFEPSATLDGHVAWITTQLNRKPGGLEQLRQRCERMWLAASVWGSNNGQLSSASLQALADTGLRLDFAVHDDGE